MVAPLLRITSRLSVSPATPSAALLTPTPPLAVPRDVAFWIRSVPLLRIHPPGKEFDDGRMTVPPPATIALANNDPPMLLTVSVSVELAPVARVALPVLKVMVPLATAAPVPRSV